jgi:hypothetical protein
VIPSQLSYWGNEKDGDCVSAEEAFAKAAASLMAGQPELFISETEVINWASAHGYLEGAELTAVMDAMAVSGMTVGGTIYGDGPYSSVDWTNDAILSNAIFQGPVKIGVAATQYDAVVGTTNGWFLLNAHNDQNIDHCTSLCGFGPLSYLAQFLGVEVPAGVDGTKRGYLNFNWDTIGIIDQPSLIAICGEAWLRTPTTVVGSQSLTHASQPGPGAPDLVRVGVELLVRELTGFLAQYPRGIERR